MLEREGVRERMKVLRSLGGVKDLEFQWKCCYREEQKQGFYRKQKEKDVNVSGFVSLIVGR